MDTKAVMLFVFGYIFCTFVVRGGVHIFFEIFLCFARVFFPLVVVLAAVLYLFAHDSFFIFCSQTGLYIMKSHTIYVSIRVHSQRSHANVKLFSCVQTERKANTKSEIVFDVCRLFFDILPWFFYLFYFRLV